MQYLSHHQPVKGNTSLWQRSWAGLLHLSAAIPNTFFFAIFSNLLLTTIAQAAVCPSAPTISMTAPANNTVTNAPASFTLTATAAACTSGTPARTITKVEFFNGASLIATDTSSPYSFAWNAVAAGTYTITAKVTDSTALTTTSAAISLKSNAAPTVSITAPATGTVVASPASFNLTANAADSDGTITQVQFLNGTTVLNTDTTAPYAFTWSAVANGTYSITARATDNNGRITTSTAISLISNAAPTVSLTAPATNTSVNALATFNLTATAADTGGSITKVEFYSSLNGASPLLINTDTTSPYAFSWTAVAAGTYTVTAKATDNSGLVTTSAAITLKSNAAPTVSMAAPATNTVVTAPATFALTANAADTDGTITQVQFLNGTTVLNTDTSAPYSFNWTGVAIGSYTVTAKATDNNGVVTTSAPITLISNNLPTVSLTAPTNGATAVAPATFSLAATAADSGGSITKVEFYGSLNGASPLLINTDTTAPYTFSWTSVAAGTYTITAKATDNNNEATTSTAVNVTAIAATTTTTLTSSVVSSVGIGQGVTYVATVTGLNPTGTVTFKEGTVTLGTAALSGSGTSVSATFFTSFSTIGIHGVTAVYGGDINDASSTSAVGNVTVTTLAPTTTAFSMTPNPATVGQIVTFSASVAGNSPTGLVTLKANSVILATGTLSGGQATLTASFTTIGLFGITVEYGGDASNAASTTFAENLRINQGSSTTTLSAAPSPASVGQNVTLTAVVTGANAAGVVTFKDGTTTLGTGTITNGIATLTTSFTAAGIHSVTATYGGDVNYTASTSTAVNVTTTASNVPPTVSITAPANNATAIAPASFNITANAADTDGTITQVQFYNGSTLLGTATTAPYSFNWSSVAAGTYSITAKATDNTGAVITSAAVGVTVTIPNVPPTVSLTAPADGATFTAPATITVTANAADSDGSITQVQFYDSGTTLLTTDTTAPYTFDLVNVGAGTYNLSAKATDNNGAQTTSSTIQFTVTSGTPQAYYIHTDQLNTPRLITDASNNKVWQWDNNDPFGNNVPNDDPNGTNTHFSFNLRFPGQYADSETGLSYNYFRDYSPQEGRYIESDPIGLDAGQISTYAYVDGSPLMYVDEEGLLLAATLGSRMRGVTQRQAVQIGAMGNTAALVGVGVATAGASLATGAAVVPEVAVGVCRIAPKLKNPCKNAILAAALGSGVCNGDPADDFISDMERRESIRRGSELAGQKKIGIQQQRP